VSPWLKTRVNTVAEALHQLADNPHLDYIVAGDWLFTKAKAREYFYNDDARMERQAGETGGDKKKKKRRRKKRA
jgi:hypothetical protein